MVMPLIVIQITIILLTLIHEYLCGEHFILYKAYDNLMHRSYTVSVNTYENMPEVKGIYTID